MGITKQLVTDLLLDVFLFLSPTVWVSLLCWRIIQWPPCDIIWPWHDVLYPERTLIQFHKIPVGGCAAWQTPPCVCHCQHLCTCHWILCRGTGADDLESNEIELYYCCIRNKIFHWNKLCFTFLAKTNSSWF